jgi:F-type H+-transporting ATPase subunit delta
MRDDVRGVLAAALVGARAARTVPTVAALLESFSTALNQSDELRRVLTDGSVPPAQRRGAVQELLRGRGADDAAQVVAYAVMAERAAELPGVVAHMVAEAEEEARRAAAGEPSPAEPPAGRSGVRDRLRGFVELTLSRLPDPSQIDRIEEELYQVANLVEANRPLEAALTDPELPLAPRQAVLHDLLHGKVRPETEDLLLYLLRAGRVRSLVRTLHWLVELTALERGRRIAEVRTAADLDVGQRARLAAALMEATGRPIELRVSIDPEAIGGMAVSVGDTVIDGTVKHRLAQLREALGASGPAA